MQEINLGRFTDTYQPEEINNQTVFYEGGWRSQHQYDAVVNTPEEHLWLGAQGTLLSVLPPNFTPEFYVITKLSHLHYPMIVYL